MYILGVYSKFPSDKINNTKSALFFSFASSFYISRNTRLVSLKLCVGFSMFDSASFLLKFIFSFNKKQGLFNFKTS